MTGYRAITRARKIVFWISATLFVLTWPLLIFYALGIVISPSAKHPVVETGVMRIETIPGGAELYLDGTDTGKTTPTAVERLSAGDYRIELRKSGYDDWRGQVKVDIQAVRRVSYAILVPRVPKVHLVPIGSHRSEQLSHNSQYLILEGRTLEELRVYDLKTERFLPNMTGLSPYLHDPVERVSQLPWGNVFLVQVLHAGRSLVLALHLGALGVDLEHAVGAGFFQDVEFAWSPTLSGAVYFKKGHMLRTMESWSSSSDRILLEMVRSVGVVNNNLFFIDSNGRFGQITAFGRRHFLFTVPQKILAEMTGATRIEYAGEKWGVALSPDGTLTLFNADGFAEYHGIRGIVADRARDRFVVWSDSRVGSLRFPTTGPALADRIDWAPPPPTNSRISDVVPAAGMSNCLFVSDGIVWIEPVLSGVVGQAERVLTLAPGERYLYSEATGFLLVIDRAITQMRVTRFITKPLLPTLE